MTTEMPRWRRVAEHAPTPCARSGHAMTYMPPTRSVLLFGGSNGRVLLPDFHVLAPRSGDDGDDEEKEDGSPLLNMGLAWTKLTAYVEEPSDEGDDDMRMPVGCGRECHSMHYVKMAPAEEQATGCRVVILGNVVHKVATSNGETQLRFYQDEMRVEEVRVRQADKSVEWMPPSIVQSSPEGWKPPGRYGHCSAVVDRRIYCFGGTDASGTKFFDDLFYYHVDRRQWRRITPTGTPPLACACAAMSVHPTKPQLFVYGGYDGDKTFSTLYMYDIRHNWWDIVGETKGMHPPPLKHLSMTSVSPHHLLLIGGRARTRRGRHRLHHSQRNSVFLFDISTRWWKHIEQTKQCEGKENQVAQNTIAIEGTTIPCGRTAIATACIPEPGNETGTARRPVDRIVLFGGYAGAKEWLDDTFVLEIPKALLEASFESSSSSPPEHDESMSPTLRRAIEEVRQEHRAAKRRRMEPRSQDLHPVPDPRAPSETTQSTNIADEQLADIREQLQHHLQEYQDQLSLTVESRFGSLDERCRQMESAVHAIQDRLQATTRSASTEASTEATNVPTTTPRRSTRQTKQIKRKRKTRRQ